MKSDFHSGRRRVEILFVKITREVVDSLDGGAFGGLPAKEELFHLRMSRRSAQALCDIMDSVLKAGHDSDVPLSMVWLFQVRRDLQHFLGLPREP